jgi:hypothetical protein
MSANWVERSERMPDGHLKRWKERAKPFQPGVLEIQYLEPEFRYRAGPPGTVRLGTSGSPRGTVTTRPARTAAPRTAATTPVSSPRKPASAPTGRAQPAVAIEVTPPLWSLPAQGELRPRVTMSKYAREQFGSTEMGNGLEVCGALWGGYERAGHEVWISAISENQGSARYGKYTDTAQLDVDWIDRLAEQNRGTGQYLVGHWHSHNRYEGERAQESPTDVSNWQSWLRASELGVWAGVIVHRSNLNDRDNAGGWLYPHFSAYVFSRDNPDTYTYVPVTVERSTR